ncbi:NUDIX domain-containing protein [Paramyrothecium foliicola]|nr:NUDIX domain-containing protein [Paramyrothecium foliicola]
MAVSSFSITNYTSEEFVESCGAVVFDFASRPTQVCLIRYLKTGEWLLPKGRRNCHETRQQAALREVQEETGYSCRLQPVTMPTRAPSAVEANDVRDAPRTYPDLDEPFMVTVRELKTGVKFIWWFITRVEESETAAEGEPGFQASFFPCNEALGKLAFQSDRDVLRRAIGLTAGIVPGAQCI